MFPVTVSGYCAHTLKHKEILPTLGWVGPVWPGGRDIITLNYWPTDNNYSLVVGLKPLGDFLG